MFGFTARHIKSSTLKEASPDACDTGNTKIETDGWYIDFEFNFECPDRPKPMHTGVPTRPDCEDEVRTRSIGKAKLGFPVLTTTTIYGPDGQVQHTITNEVVELSRDTLAAALFDVPEGYRLVTNHQELYGMAGGASQTAVDRTNRIPPRNDVDPNSRNPVISEAANSPAGFVSASSPKKPGVARIGIMLPKAQMAGENGAQAAEALRSTFASFLNGPNVELVALNSRLSSQALEEAKQAQCDFVLSSSLTQKKGGGGMFGKVLGNIATSAVGHVPGASTAGGAVARSVAIRSVYTAADVSRSIKSKDELSLEYRLESTNGTKPGLSKTVKAKARSDGEDIFAGVRVDIQLKTHKISDAKKFASTFGDILGNALSFLTGDIPGGLVGTAAETLYRSNWRRSEPLFFLVYDWEPCEGWEGTISIKTELTQYEESTTSGLFSSTEKKYEFEATLNVTNTKDTSESFTNGYFADAVMRTEEIVTQVNKNPYTAGFCDTGQRTAGGSKVTVRVRGTSTTVNTMENIGAGTGRGTVYIATRGAEGVNILIKPPPPYQGVYRHTFKYQFPQCPLWEKVNSSGPEERPRTSGMPTVEFLATFDENGALAGSKTVKQGDGTVTYKWNLQKCK